MTCYLLLRVENFRPYIRQCCSKIALTRCGLDFLQDVAIDLVRFFIDAVTENPKFRGMYISVECLEEVKSQLGKALPNISMGKVVNFRGPELSQLWYRMCGTRLTYQAGDYFAAVLDAFFTMVSIVSLGEKVCAITGNPIMATVRADALLLMQTLKSPKLNMWPKWLSGEEKLWGVQQLQLAPCIDKSLMASGCRTLYGDGHNNAHFTFQIDASSVSSRGYTALPPFTAVDPTWSFQVVVEPLTENNVRYYCFAIRVDPESMPRNSMWLRPIKGAVTLINHKDHSQSICQTFADCFTPTNLRLGWKNFVTTARATSSTEGFYYNKQLTLFVNLEPRSLNQQPRAMLDCPSPLSSLIHVYMNLAFFYKTIVQMPESDSSVVRSTSHDGDFAPGVPKKNLDYSWFYGPISFDRVRKLLKRTFHMMEVVQDIDTFSMKFLWEVFGDWNRHMDPAEIHIAFLRLVQHFQKGSGVESVVRDLFEGEITTALVYDKPPPEYEKQENADGSGHDGKWIGKGKTEKFYSISVPVKGCNDLVQSMCRVFSKAPLGEVTGDPPVEPGMPQVRRQISKAPPFVSIWLNRFEWNGALGQTQKISSRLGFFNSFSLSDFFALNCNFANPPEYMLCSILLHHGSTTDGRFSVLVKRKTLGWIHIDGNERTIVEAGKAFSMGAGDSNSTDSMCAYGLFYCRRTEYDFLIDHRNFSFPPKLLEIMNSDALRNFPRRPNEDWMKIHVEVGTLASAQMDSSFDVWQWRGADPFDEVPKNTETSFWFHLRTSERQMKEEIVKRWLGGSGDAADIDHFQFYMWNGSFGESWELLENRHNKRWLEKANRRRLFVWVLRLPATSFSATKSNNEVEDPILVLFKGWQKSGGSGGGGESGADDGAEDADVGADDDDADIGGDSTNGENAIAGESTSQTIKSTKEKITFPLLCAKTISGASTPSDVREILKKGGHLAGAGMSGGDPGKQFQLVFERSLGTLEPLDETKTMKDNLTGHGRTVYVIPPGVPLRRDIPIMDDVEEKTVEIADLSLGNEKYTPFQHPDFLSTNTNEELPSSVGSGAIRGNTPNKEMKYRDIDKTIYYEVLDGGVVPEPWCTVRAPDCVIVKVGTTENNSSPEKENAVDNPEAREGADNEVDEQGKVTEGDGASERGEGMHADSSDYCTSLAAHTLESTFCRVLSKVSGPAINKFRLSGRNWLCFDTNSPPTFPPTRTVPPLFIASSKYHSTDVLDDIFVVTRSRDWEGRVSPTAPLLVDLTSPHFQFNSRHPSRCNPLDVPDELEGAGSDNTIAIDEAKVKEAIEWCSAVRTSMHHLKAIATEINGLETITAAFSCGDGATKDGTDGFDVSASEEERLKSTVRALKAELKFLQEQTTMETKESNPASVDIGQQNSSKLETVNTLEKEKKELLRKCLSSMKLKHAVVQEQLSTLEKIDNLRDQLHGFTCPYIDPIAVDLSNSAAVLPETVVSQFPTSSGFRLATPSDLTKARNRALSRSDRFEWAVLSSLTDTVTVEQLNKNGGIGRRKPPVATSQSDKKPSPKPMSVQSIRFSIMSMRGNERVGSTASLSPVAKCSDGVGDGDDKEAVDTTSELLLDMERALENLDSEQQRLKELHSKWMHARKKLKKEIKAAETVLSMCSAHLRRIRPAMAGNSESCMQHLTEPIETETNGEGEGGGEGGGEGEGEGEGEGVGNSSKKKPRNDDDDGFVGRTSRAVMTTVNIPMPNPMEVSEIERQLRVSIRKFTKLRGNLDGWFRQVLPRLFYLFDRTMGSFDKDSVKSSGQKALEVIEEKCRSYEMVMSEGQGGRVDMLNMYLKSLHSRRGVLEGKLEELEEKARKLRKSGGGGGGTSTTHKAEYDKVKQYIQDTLHELEDDIPDAIARVERDLAEVEGLLDEDVATATVGSGGKSGDGDDEDEPTDSRIRLKDLKKTLLTNDVGLTTLPVGVDGHRSFKGHNTHNIYQVKLGGETVAIKEFPRMAVNPLPPSDGSPTPAMATGDDAISTHHFWSGMDACLRIHRAVSHPCVIPLLGRVYDPTIGDFLKYPFYPKGSLLAWWTQEASSGGGGDKMKGKSPAGGAGGDVGGSSQESEATTDAAAAAGGRQPTTGWLGMRLQTILLQTLRGLECLHSHGFAHGNIHESNILLGDGDPPLPILSGFSNSVTAAVATSDDGGSRCAELGHAGSDITSMQKEDILAFGEMAWRLLMPPGVRATPPSPSLPEKVRQRLFSKASLIHPDFSLMIGSMTHPNSSQRPTATHALGMAFFLKPFFGFDKTQAEGSITAAQRWGEAGISREGVDLRVLNQVRGTQAQIQASKKGGMSIKLSVDRANIVEATRNAFTQVQIASYCMLPLQISFKGEGSEYHAGLSDEFFTEFFSQLIERYCDCPYDVALPSDKAGLEDIFRVAGVVLLLCILQEKTIATNSGATISRAVYAHILQQPPNEDDLHVFDEERGRHLHAVMVMSDEERKKCCLSFPTAKSSSFTHDSESSSGVGNSSGGDGGEAAGEEETREVTSHNIRDYQISYVNYILRDCRRQNMDAIADGFWSGWMADWDKVHAELWNTLRQLSPTEFQLLACGTPVLDVEKLIEKLDLTNCREETGTWLKEVLRECDNPDLLRGFLVFVSGRASLPNPYDSRVAKQKVTVRDHAASDMSRLPSSFTCGNEIQIPKYPTKEMFKSRLTAAISNGATGYAS